MCDCSLVCQTCVCHTLCGISTSFPVLFLSHRQVTHALLTRPPLTYSRKNKSVRLECVMHAASVHPEPGSNSLINCILSSYEAKIFFLRAVLLLYYFLFEFFSLKEFFKSSVFVHFLSLNFFSSLFNFQGSFTLAPAECLAIISSTPLIVKGFFKVFLKFFSFFKGLELSAKK